MMLERTYVDIFINWVVEKVPEIYNKIKNYFNKILKFNISLDDLEEIARDEEDRYFDE